MLRAAVSPKRARARARAGNTGGLIRRALRVERATPRMPCPDITKGPAWTQEAPHGDLVRATPLIDDQKNIYVTTIAGRTYKLSVDGKPLWSHYTGSRGTVPGVPALWDSVMLMLTKHGHLIALDLDTGVERWEKQIVARVATSCDCALLTQGILVVAVMDPEPLKLLTDPMAEYVAENNRLLGLSLDDGSFRWSFAPRQSTYNFQGSTIHDGTFVFQDVTGGVLSDVYGGPPDLVLCDT